MTSIASNREMDVCAILKVCMTGAIPVNTSVEAAIEAHQAAIEQYRKSRDESDMLLAGLALRAISFAATPTTESVRRQIDYLTALPMDAWECACHRLKRDPADYREAVLAVTARSLTWMADA